MKLMNKKTMKCRFTGDSIPIIHSFGNQPIANGFLKDRENNHEYFFEMSVAVNLENGLFQLVNQPDPSQLFHENYAFFSRTSNFMKIHFESVADEMLQILSRDNKNYESVSVSTSYLSNIEFIDQNPIGKSSRSNPATYLKVYDDIRELFTSQPLARRRSYKNWVFLL